MKKAIVMSQTVLVIISALVMMVLIIVMYQIGLAQEDQSAEAICKLSIEARSVGKQTTTEPIVPIKCKRDHKYFQKESQDEVNVQILNEVRDCIYEVGEGKLDFAASGKFFSDNTCVVCSTIEFVEESKSAKNYDSESFNQFISRAQRQEGQTWREFFDSTKVMSEKGEDKTVHEGFFMEVPKVVDPSKKYLIFFKFLPKSTAETVLTKFDKDLDINTYPTLIMEEMKVNNQFDQCEVLLN